MPYTDSQEVNEMMDQTLFKRELSCGFSKKKVILTFCPFVRSSIIQTVVMIDVFSMLQLEMLTNDSLSSAGCDSVQ